jgi:aminoglycoside phosphotransferase (APT) family kinase protein
MTRAGTAAVRGEELAIEPVHEWLGAQVADLPAALPSTRQFRSGASNWTYLLEYADRRLVLRRPPAGTKARSAHDMRREYRVQAALRPAYGTVPQMLALCTDEEVLGCDFYVMEFLDGVIPRGRFPELAAAGPERAGSVCRAVLARLRALHALDPVEVGLADLGRGEGYARRQIDGWSKRFADARTWNVHEMRYVRDWLDRNTPRDLGACIIHNDFRLDNVVLDAEDLTRVVGVLDWEMATVGDPLMDLGAALAYWVHADDPPLMRATRRQPTHLPGMLRREEVVEQYLDASGLRPERWVFYEVYGLFRLAVIAQQIYYRYHHGQSRNPAFRHFWVLVNYLGWRCRSRIREAGA